jgi:hypothetical protein
MRYQEKSKSLKIKFKSLIENDVDLIIQEKLSKKDKMKDAHVVIDIQKLKKALQDSIEFIKFDKIEDRNEEEPRKKKSKQLESEEDKKPEEKKKKKHKLEERIDEPEESMIDTRVNKKKEIVNP